MKTKDFTSVSNGLSVKDAFFVLKCVEIRDECIHINYDVYASQEAFESKKMPVSGMHKTVMVDEFSQALSDARSALLAEVEKLV